MKFMDKIKNYINVTDSDYDDLGDFDVEEIPANEEHYTAQPKAAKKSRKAEQDASANVVDFKSGSRPAARGFNESQVVVKRVKGMNEIGSVIEALKSGLIVVLNLEDCDDDIDQRIIDCIFGANYALGGDFKSIADKAYVITPRNVAVSDDGITELGDDLEG
ncbi:MAG: cell division protein SepF [Clostridia bacterium]|nr:cell division protein SepF [Clostridia bacterium]